MSTSCGNGTCEPNLGEDCSVCPVDCICADDAGVPDVIRDDSQSHDINQADTRDYDVDHADRQVIDSMRHDAHATTAVERTVLFKTRAPRRQNLFGLGSTCATAGKMTISCADPL